MKHWPTTLLLCLALLPAAPALAQSCNSTAPITSPNERFRDNGDGTITDLSSGLIWSRCSLGQQWRNKHCEGQPRPLLWSTAALLPSDGWRLPELKELAALVELQCVRPAINLKLFPNTPPASYWTATRFVNRDGEYWQVLFLQGASIPEREDAAALVRLVREGDREP
ncbi:MAG: DUF1566 domain-containing protein [Gammaproteobacteria bacterium]|nr:DUF1566 domain-containing protein [Gammaproteobacteria bacterium]